MVGREDGARVYPQKPPSDLTDANVELRLARVSVAIPDANDIARQDGHRLKNRY